MLKNSAQRIGKKNLCLHFSNTRKQFRTICLYLNLRQRNVQLVVYFEHPYGQNRVSNWLKEDLSIPFPNGNRVMDSIKNNNFFDIISSAWASLWMQFQLNWNKTSFWRNVETIAMFKIEWNEPTFLTEKWKLIL